MREFSRAELRDFAVFCFEKVWCQPSRMKMAHEIGLTLPGNQDLHIFGKTGIKASLNLLQEQGSQERFWKVSTFLQLLSTFCSI